MKAKESDLLGHPLFYLIKAEIQRLLLRQYEPKDKIEPEQQ